MSKQAFSKAIDDFFAAQPCENAGDAATALLLLYDVIEEHAISAESQEQGSKEFSESLVMVQQAICWTPLRYFLDDLAQDTHLAIRAGAKGEISDQRPGAFWNDPEVGLVAAANLSIMFSARMGELQAEVGSDFRFTEASRRWSLSTQGRSFTPKLTITAI
jgi:hypothetical protein